MRRCFSGWSLQWGAALLLAGLVGRWAQASAAEDQPTRYPDVWGTIVSTTPDITYMIGALKRDSGEVTIFYGFSRDAFGHYDERIMSIDFFPNADLSSIKGCSKTDPTRTTSPRRPLTEFSASPACAAKTRSSRRRSPMATNSGTSSQVCRLG
jgi:hypothetical protein